MFDIHAHLHDSAFDADRDEVVRRAKEAGVEKIVTIGTNIEESRRAIACAEKYENVYASIGVHPELFNKIEKELQIADLRLQIDEVKELATHPKIVAIGECGLDYYVHQGSGNSEQGTGNSQQKKIQQEGFLAQIELAHELNLPLIIHCRPSVGTMDAYEDLFLILKSKIINLKSVVLHCYMGDTEVTEKFLTLPNVYFSCTGNITYPVKKVLVGTKDDIRETVKMIPIDRILAETDCPYLAPMPHRGKRNEPAFVPLVVQKIVEIQGISLVETLSALDASAKRIFAL